VVVGTVARPNAAHCQASQINQAGKGSTASRSNKDLAALEQQIGKLEADGKYAEALVLTQRLVALTRARFGVNSTKHADALDELAKIHFLQSRFADAAPVYERVLAIRRTVLGPRHADVLESIVQLADMYARTERAPKGEALLRQGIAERERAVGRNHASLADALRTLASIEMTLQKYAAAETSMRRAVALSKTAKQKPSDIAMLLGTQAELALRQDRIADAERSLTEALLLHQKAHQVDPGSQMAHVLSLMQLMRLYILTERLEQASPLGERALAMSEKVLGPDHPNIAGQLAVVATTYENRGRYAEAEVLHKRAIAIVESNEGNASLAFASVLNGLGLLYGFQNRHDEALGLQLRALQTAEQALGSDNPALHRYLSDVAGRYFMLRRFNDAEPLLIRALAGVEKAPNADPFVAGLHRTAILQSLARICQLQSRFAEARAFLDRALEVVVKVWGPDHSQVGDILSSLALLHLQQDQLDDAERLFERALPITAKSGKDDTSYGSTMAGVAMVHYKREDWPKAYAAMKTASATYISADQRAAAGVAMRTDDPTQGKAIPHAVLYLAQAFTAHYLAEKDAAQTDALREDAFQMVQRAQSSRAAAALGQMAARFSAGTDALAALVRERQDVTASWQTLNTRITAALAAPPAQRNPLQEQAMRDQLATLTTRLDALNARFAKEVPEYAALSNPQPVTLAEAQDLIGSEEAALVIASQANESLIWVIAKNAVRWFRVPFGEEALTREVAALRCGLDNWLWNVADTYDKCVDLVKSHRYDANIEGRFVQVLPFDLKRAHELYKTLLGSTEEMIKDKHLLIVPSGPLTSLPFNVLVTESPRTAIPDNIADYAEAAWLGMRRPLSMLPSVTSLRALRQFAKPGLASKTYLGYGNPLLEGPQTGQWREIFTQRAQLARAKSCAGPLPSMQTPIPAGLGRRSVGDFDQLLKGPRADIEQIRRQTPLPESADELCEIGRRLGAPVSDVILGEKATEATLKDLSDKGSLAGYGIVHFATHGALTGQLTGWSEPGLILTPPPAGTSDAAALQRDDGYLTASEVATLKFNANWVVLSGCYTGGASGENAEALSGLARAFFYAGSRALLVSHWDVESDAAVRLTTHAFGQLSADPTIGRAEAFRLSMRELFRKGKTEEAHPSVWGPFVLVGEGAAER
jgi:CHAT domain-containing protein/tetratricopeptide (TPR) repeat protein